MDHDITYEDIEFVRNAMAHPMIPKEEEIMEQVFELSLLQMQAVVQLIEELVSEVDMISSDQEAVMNELREILTKQGATVAVEAQKETDDGDKEKAAAATNQS